jgi:hypothetical protein
LSRCYFECSYELACNTSNLTTPLRSEAQRSIAHRNALNTTTPHHITPHRTVPHCAAQHRTAHLSLDNRHTLLRSTSASVELCTSLPCCRDMRSTINAERKPRPIDDDAHFRRVPSCCPANETFGCTIYGTCQDQGSPKNMY